MDPPRRLVLRGPYRYVRNPMISGILLVLFGEAGMLLSRPQLEWALVFLVLNLIYVPLVEEPMLIERFGADHRKYRRHVPALLPRGRPWQPERAADRTWRTIRASARERITCRPAHQPRWSGGTRR